MIAETSSGAPPQNETTMGHNSISELTLVAYITPGCKVLTDAANLVANQGKNERFKITISELAKDKSVVKLMVYENCLLTSLDFPTLSTHGAEILCETATFKPESVYVK